jgi:hypothetical protein
VFSILFINRFFRVYFCEPALFKLDNGIYLLIAICVLAPSIAIAMMIYLSSEKSFVTSV